MEMFTGGKISIEHIRMRFDQSVGIHEKSLENQGFETGGEYRSRTGDLLHAMQAL